MSEHGVAMKDERSRLHLHLERVIDKVELGVLGVLFVEGLDGLFGLLLESADLARDAPSALVGLFQSHDL